MKALPFIRYLSDKSPLDTVRAYFAPDSLLCVHKCFPSNGRQWRQQDGWTVSHVKTGLALSSLTKTQRTRAAALKIMEALSKLGNVWSFKTTSSMPGELLFLCREVLIAVAKGEDS